MRSGNDCDTMAMNRRVFLSLTGSLIAGLLLRHEWIAAEPLSTARFKAGAIRRGDQRIALISDLNASYGSTRYISQVHRGVKLLQGFQPDLVLCAGDMVAGQKLGLTAHQLDGMWAAFNQSVLQPLRAEGEAFAPCMGNHDASSIKQRGAFLFNLDRQRAASFWNQQKNELGLSFLEASHFPFRYSIRQADLFALILDASSANIPAADLAWAEEQLSTSTAKQAKLRLVVGHLPPYPISQRKDRAGEVLNQPQQLMALLERHDVALYVSGHHHAWFPGRVGTINLLSLGAMGSGPRQRLNDHHPPTQTLTLLDVFSSNGEMIETTIDINTLEILKPEALPVALTPDRSPNMNRRSTQLRI